MAGVEGHGGRGGKRSGGNGNKHDQRSALCRIHPGARSRRAAGEDGSCKISIALT